MAPSSCSMREESGDYTRLFLLESWRVIVEKRLDGEVQTEATIKIIAPPGPEEAHFICTAEGNGPVNALDNALREAIGDIYPHLRDIELVNFKVRILDEAKGTGAVTRVLIDASDGQRLWGINRGLWNVIEASWDALVDSLEVRDQFRLRRAHCLARRETDPVLSGEDAIRPRSAGARRAGGGLVAEVLAPAAYRSALTCPYSSACSPSVRRALLPPRCRAARPGFISPCGRSGCPRATR